MVLYVHVVRCPKHVDGMAYNIDPDQTAEYYSIQSDKTIRIINTLL